MAVGRRANMLPGITKTWVRGGVVLVRRRLLGVGSHRSPDVGLSAAMFMARLNILDSEPARINAGSAAHMLT